jgi:hypothetical protein
VADILTVEYLSISQFNTLSIASVFTIIEKHVEISGM